MWEFTAKNAGVAGKWEFCGEMGVYGKKCGSLQENGSFTGKWEARLGLRLGKVAGQLQVQ